MTTWFIWCPTWWESRILKGSDGFVQGYNTQIAVEPLFQLIVGQRVTQAANDKQQLVPCWRRSRNSRDKNRKKLWPTMGIARMRI